MARGFGDDAQLWAQRFPAGIDLIVSDFHRLPVALAHAGALKRKGRIVAGSVFIPDVRAKTAAATAASLLDQVLDVDSRIGFFVGLAAETLITSDVPQKEWYKLDPVGIYAASEFLAGCDVLVTRSSIETQRLFALDVALPETIVTAAPLDPLVPPPAGRPALRDRVVVWAPRADRGQLALFAQGLAALRIPVVIVGSNPSPPLPETSAVFCPLERAADALAAALVIVDGSVYDPGTARALAAYDVPIVTAWTSGAHEWLRPVYPYAPWDTRAIFHATMTALGGRPPRPARSDDGIADVVSTMQTEAEALYADGPLVSIIIPTYNRRHWLPAALRSVADQRYANVEIIVVNDGGDDVSDLVAATPRARLVENERNSGVTFSINAGISAARGEYVALLADDDLMCPDQVSRLVAALERSGLPIGHSNALVSHYDVDALGEMTLSGHHVGSPRPTFPPEVLVRNQISGPGMMFRRSIFDQEGLFDDAFEHGSDFDMWMRLSRRHDFAFVNHITVQVSMRNDASQLSSVSGADTARLLERIYARHPVTGRAVLERLRAEQVEHISKQAVFTCSPTRSLSAADVEELRALDAIPQWNDSCGVAHAAKSTSLV
jgi:hypothetical protein